MRRPWWWPSSGKPDNERSWAGFPDLEGPLIRPGRTVRPTLPKPPAEIVLVEVVIGGVTHLKAMPRRHQ